MNITRHAHTTTVMTRLAAALVSLVPSFEFSRPAHTRTQRERCRKRERVHTDREGKEIEKKRRGKETNENQRHRVSDKLIWCCKLYDSVSVVPTLLSLCTLASVSFVPHVTHIHTHARAHTHTHKAGAGHLRSK